MKYMLKQIALFLTVILLGFLAGRKYEFLKTGFRQKVLDSTTLPFQEGKATLSHTYESVGWPFFDLPTSRIQLCLSTGTRIDAYQAKQVFQEPDPYVKDISVEGGSLVWEDMINLYRLTVTPIDKTNRAEQGSPAYPPQGVGSPDP